MIKQMQPGAQVIGLDGDLAILSIAREKASHYGMEIIFEPGNVIALPYADQSFDRVLSTLVMSLLSREEKTLAIREAYRVLRNSGEIHIADFGQPHPWWGPMVAPVVLALDIYTNQPIFMYRSIWKTHCLRLNCTSHQPAKSWFCALD
jgi:ubiquinone/menaquinone biosynthesis C-methylase UbiE